MRRILATCLLLAIALPCRAQEDEPKPNTLTAKEIADGWELLFDGKTTKCWDVGFSSSKSESVVKDGVLELGGLGNGHIISPRSYTEFELQVEYKSEPGYVSLGVAAPKQQGKVRRTLSVAPNANKDWTLVKFNTEGGKVHFDVGGSKSSQEWTGPAFITFGQNQGANLKLRNIKIRPLEQDKPKPNTLTAKEIADGWILLFDGETTFGWETKGKVRVENGTVIISTRSSEITQRTEFGAHEIQFEYRAPVSPTGKEKGLAQFALRGNLQPMGAGLSPEKGEWNHARFLYELDPKLLIAEGQIFINGQPRGGLRVGPIGDDRYEKFIFNRPAFVGHYDRNLEVRNIKLRPLNTNSLFNGKDLTGWKEFPGKKSKFAVVDGAINVKDGPGDLQTVGKYKHFIVQLDCISNGKHLNSGIFFRCRDNEYQNGYEAQIRNEFTDKPTQKYQIEEYDPKTNKLLGKKEQLFTAVDYGTGAIYRRQPARKQMSKDGEWFAMTIVAHGNHLATWVNGVQVTDWYDHRPKSDNARTGCKLEAGHISIQGHDPTTDLSFKNFRIAELK